MAYSPANARRRTILMPESRSAQIALAATELGVSSEQFIQSAITAALITLAGNDDVLAFALARAGGMDWDELSEFAKVRAARKSGRAA